MKPKVLAALAPLLFIAFTPDSGMTDTLYHNSLKFLKSADGPRTVKMVRYGRRTGQSTMVDDGVLFTYKNRGAKEVLIAGGFSGWKTHRMERSEHGVWYFFLPGGSARSVTYKFMVDGIWTADPVNYDRIDDRMGSYISVAESPVRGEGKQVSWRSLGGRTIEFRLYRPDAAFVSLVGDFNHWNPEHDLLEKGGNGIWRLTKKLHPGLYRYKFVVDGDWLPDLYNPQSGSDDTGEVCSIIEIKK